MVHNMLLQFDAGHGSAVRSWSGKRRLVETIARTPARSTRPFPSRTSRPGGLLLDRYDAQPGDPTRATPAQYERLLEFAEPTDVSYAG
jgi:hypothetical protein